MKSASNAEKTRQMITSFLSACSTARFRARTRAIELSGMAKDGFKVGYSLAVRLQMNTEGNEALPGTAKAQKGNDVRVRVIYREAHFDGQNPLGKSIYFNRDASTCAFIVSAPNTLTTLKAQSIRYRRCRKSRYAF